MFPNIEAERARHGMTLDDFTRAIGVCRKTYYNWREAGKVPDSKAVEIAELFNVPIEYIKGETKTQEEENEGITGIHK